MAPILPDAGHTDLPEIVALHYLNEGAANILYRIVAVPRTRPPIEGQGPAAGTPPYLPGNPTGLLPETSNLTVFDNMLLRLRKDLPTTTPSAETHDAWRRQIFPLLNGDLVQQLLVKLPAELITKLNIELRSWEEYDYEMKGPGQTIRTRPTKRRGVYLAEDEYGILVWDMTPKLPNQILLEFKPKWLVQSPAAPEKAQRCRTCALNARRNALRAERGEDLEQSICPLDLVSRDLTCASHVSKQLLGKYDLHHFVMNRFTNEIRRSAPLNKLKTYQWVFDRLGVFESDPNSDSFLKAMTLRDCSMFVQVSTDQEHPLVVKLGDFDLKSPSKIAYWKSVEEQLIREGWYMGTEPAKDKQPLTCNLSTDRWNEVEKLENMVANTVIS